MFFTVSNIDWDADSDYDCLDLPSSVKVKYKDLLHPDEKLENINIEDLKDRVVDFLSDLFGFCINQCVID